MTIVALLLITALNLGSGAVVTAPLLAGRRPLVLSLPERIFLLLGVGTLLNSGLAFLLTYLELFSLARFLLIVLLLTGLAVLTLWRRGWRPAFRELQASAQPSAAARLPLVGWTIPAGVEPLLLALWLAGAAALFMRPHEITWGGADAGVYVNLAATLAEHGTLRIEDDVLAGLDPGLYDAFLRRMPDGTPFWSSGLLVPDQTGRIFPPFYHLHTIWQAVAYAVAGVPGALRMTAYWALLGSAAVYLTLRRLLPARAWWIALGALGGLTITALQVWFARYPTTEMLTQFLFWLGLWAFVRWSDDDYRRGAWGAIAGAAWGATFLVRVDTFFVWALPGVLVLLLTGWKRWAWSQAWFFAFLVLLPAAATAYALRFVRPYFENVYGYTLTVALGFWPLLVLGAAAGLGLLVLLARDRRGIWQEVERLWPAARLFIVVIAAGLLLYGWFLRPRLGSPLNYVNPWDNVPVQQWNHMSLRHLGWYLSPLGVALSGAGILLLWWRVDRKSWAVALLGSIFSLLYLWNIRSNGVQMYALRRYVPVVLPFFVVAAAALFARVNDRPVAPDRGPGSRRRQAAALLLLLAWLGGLAWTTRGAVSQVDYATLPDQIAGLSERLPPGSILLFNQQRAVDLGDHLGVPLTLIHGHHAFTLHHLEALDLALFDAAVAGWQAAGRPVYWVELEASNPLPFEPGRLTYAFEFALAFDFLEGTYDRRPTQVIPMIWPGTVYLLAPE